MEMLALDDSRKASSAPKRVGSTSELTDDVLANIKIKLQPQTSFSKVWDSRGLGVREEEEPESVGVAAMRVARVRCLYTRCVRVLRCQSAVASMGLGA